MTKKPTVGEIKKYLKQYNPLDLGGAAVELVSDHNHLHYKLTKGDQTYCLRMANPESYRAGEWLTMAEEFVILKHLESIRLAPRPFYVDMENFVLPLIIQEFVTDIVCFNDLSLTETHLTAAAQAVAQLNTQNITPANFPFRFTRCSYDSAVKKWQARLNVIKKAKQKGVLNWARKVEQITKKAAVKLKGFDDLLQRSAFTFNFDGAHYGNTYWKDDRIVFLDWQKVSWGDPAFTLARFLSAVRADDKQDFDVVKPVMLRAYLAANKVPDFEKLVDQRLFEREISDLVWVLWHYVESGKKGRVEDKTGIEKRYRRAQALL